MSRLVGSGPPPAIPRASQVAIVVKNLHAKAGDRRDVGSVLGPGRSPGVGNANLLQYSCLEKSMDRGVWRATVRGVAKTQTWASDWTHVHCCLKGKLRQWYQKMERTEVKQQQEVPSAGEGGGLSRQDCWGYRQGQLTGQQFQRLVTAVAHKLQGSGESREQIS